MGDIFVLLFPNTYCHVQIVPNLKEQNNKHLLQDEFCAGVVLLNGVQVLSVWGTLKNSKFENLLNNLKLQMNIYPKLKEKIILLKLLVQYFY